MQNKRFPASLLLVMRITMLQVTLALTFTFSVFAGSGMAQTTLDKPVTLTVRETPIIKVLSRLQKQTGARFLFSPEGIDVQRRVSCSVADKPLKDFIEEVFGPLHIGFRLVDEKILLFTTGEVGVHTEATKNDLTSSAVPDRTIEGIINDDKGSPVAGATVNLKGTSVTTTSDTKGRFVLRLPSDVSNPVLVVSSVGYLVLEVPVGTGKSLAIRLTSSSEQLNEVVVIGYGTQKKVDVTGAVSQVAGKEIKAVPVPSISNAFAGRLTGVIGMNGSGEPGYDDATLLIRGISTTGDASPLVVIDGVADRAGSFSRIDANDIETISVLKDASAAIYGSRAANGVILITTKRGKSGKPTINYTYNYGLRQPTRLPKMLDAATYAQAINELDTTAGAAPQYTAADIQKYRDGSDPLGHPNTNWFKESLRPASGQYQHNLSVSGGSDKVRYYLSVGNQHQDGYYKNGATRYDQYNVRSNIDAQVTDNLKLFLNLAVRQEERQYPHHGSETIFRYMIAGNPKALAYIPGTNLPAIALGDDVNPVAAVTDRAGYQKDHRTFINGDLGFTLDMPWLTRGLSVTGGLYADRSYVYQKNFAKAFYLYSADANGKPVPQIYDQTVNADGSLGNANLTENMSQDQGITANIRLAYNRKFNGVHDISAMVAYEQYTYRYDVLSGARYNFLSAQVDELFAGAVDNQRTVDGSASEAARQNYFGRVGYGFKEKYLFQFNWRYDGSQNFPSNKRFGFFPGVSAGWRISQESFMKDLDWVSNLKLRGSWGQMGNDKIPQFQYLSSYTFQGVQGGIFGGSTPVASTGAVNTGTPNVNVTWEVANTTDIGLEGSVLNNMIDFTIDAFYTKRKNMLQVPNAAIPAYLGLSLPNQNIGTAENRGIEVALNYKRTIGKVSFQVGANFTYNKSKILYIAEAASSQPWQMATGKPIGSNFVLMQATGIFRTWDDVNKTPHLSGTKPGDLIYKDVNGDGAIDSKDEVRMDKSSTPRIVYGIPVGINYKGWNLNMLWQGQAIAAQYVYFQSGTIGNFTQEYWDNHWTPQNANASGPRLYDRETIPSTQFQNTFFLRSAAFIRLKNLQLAYNFNKRQLRRMPFSDLQVYVSGFNLLTVDKLKYIDPEGVANGQNYAGWYTPQTRVFNVGLNVNF